MHDIAKRFAKLKELLKKVSGSKPGFQQHKIIVDFIESTIDKELRKGLITDDWEDQLANGIIEPIYQAYQITCECRVLAIINQLKYHSNLPSLKNKTNLISIYPV